MTDSKREIPVELTESEAVAIDEKAEMQGVSTPDFMAYCVRTLSFGINYAVRMLPNQGQRGTPEKE